MASAAALAARSSRLLGLHLNDAYGKRDDGLMVGAVHTVQTIELLRQLPEAPQLALVAGVGGRVALEARAPPRGGPALRGQAVCKDVP